MKQAALNDKNLVVGILTDAYQNDPHINYLLEKSRNKNKMRIAMEYIFDVSYATGEIYLNEDKTAVALWDTKRKPKSLLSGIFLRIGLTIQLGFETTMRILKLNQILEMNLPKGKKIARLYTLAISRKGRGKGYTKKLIDFMVDKMTGSKTPVYIDTLKASDMGLFCKSGFHLFKAIEFDNQKLFFMNKNF